MKWVQRTPKIQYKKNDDIITKLAKIYGIEDIDEFLTPTESSLHDPYLLNNIEFARDKILSAVFDGKKISILADVDADGITSGAMMYNFLTNFTENVELFSNQRSQGHGIRESKDRIPEGTELLIIVDSSTSDAEACEEISARGIDILIIDHHPPERENPHALIVNCQLDDYPNKQLSGAGHVWKVVCVLDDALDTTFASYYIDLAGIGIHADNMSMMEKENRYLVHMAIKEIKNIGVKALLSANKKDYVNITSNHIGFTIAPMLNAMSRMDKIELALDLLTATTMDDAVKLAKEATKLNNERKKQQATFTNEFLTQVNNDDKVAIIISDEVGKNFAGLVAGEMAGKLQRPVMVVAPSGKSGKVYSGSFRSYEGFPLRSHLEKFSDLLTFVAGHEGAGGIGIPNWKFDEFKQKLNDSLADTEFKQEVVYDLEFHVDDIDNGLIYDVMKFTRINGEGIREAKFKVTGLFVGEVSILGDNKDTVKIISDDFELLKFRTTEKFYDSVSLFEDVEAVGTLSMNSWYNYKTRQAKLTRQMFLEEYRVVEDLTGTA